MGARLDRFLTMSTLVRVIDTGSFSAAARQLNVGQPAVSKTIAQLEARLGVRLLVRSTRGLMPTEAGLRFYERACRAIEEAEAAEQAAVGSGKGLGGRLRVAAAPTFARLHVIPQLPAFMAEHPELDLELILDDGTIDLIGGSIDVSLRMGDLASSALTARRLAQGERLVVATPAYLARHGTPRTPADLAAHEAIALTQPPPVWRFEREGSETSIAVTGRLRVSSAEGLRAAVLADLGLAVASRWMFAPELAAGEVTALLPGWRLPAIDLWAVYPTGRLQSVKAKTFIAHLERQLTRSDPPVHSCRA